MPVVALDYGELNSLSIDAGSDDAPGDEVAEVKLSDADGGEFSGAQWRRIAYGSVVPFALLQSRNSSIDSMQYKKDWSEHVMEYNKEINDLLDNSKPSVSSMFEDPKTILKKAEEPTSVKAAWELMEMFYADKKSQTWIPERLLHLANFDCLFSKSQSTVHEELMAFQEELVTVQAVENDSDYWEVLLSALAVGWLDVVVKLLCLHGSYLFDQLGTRESPLQSNVSLARTLRVPLFVHQALHSGTRKHVWPSQKCMHLKPTRHKLMGLLVVILEENTEVVLAECSRSFGPWMITHAIELLTAGSAQEEILLHEKRSKIGGICMEELHRLIYAQILSSHAFTWNIAPIYLTSCMKQGLHLLENLLYKQPVQYYQSIEISRLNGLDYLSSNMMKIAGVHYWKHGKKGLAVFWLKQARDEVRLNRIAKQLYDFVGKSVSDESFKLWEEMIELLGNEPGTAGGLEFLKKYKDFRQSLQQVQEGITTMIP
ncbi:Nuclear pore complex protein NUP85 [Striga hermonthica]|uniref:Nuclear pore complex protein Nup85 n=1 Tax=Striga hermonthica TaxID=68872 RepID=A0A9N7NM05_STRHE|nr:Nuclear pore complex protein NUP85 [Striga hermonthica]